MDKKLHLISTRLPPTRCSPRQKVDSRSNSRPSGEHPRRRFCAVPSSLRRSCLYWGLGCLVAAFSALSRLPVGHCATIVSYGDSYQQCTLPPDVYVETAGITRQTVFSLCIKTSRGLGATLDNADRFFIGNKTSFLDFATACYDIKDVFLVLKNATSGKHTFQKAGGLPPEFGYQGWDLSLWTTYNATSSQKVNLTVSNNGAGSLQFVGIDYNSLNLPRDFTFGRGDVVTLELEFRKVQLTYYSLPILQEYLLNGNPLSPGMTAFAFTMSPTSGQFYTNITYALVKYDPFDPFDQYQFLLYEAQWSPPSTTVGRGRRLLAAAASKNKAPAAACSGASCRPATPLPKTCKPGAKGVNYPACLRSCGCFTSRR